MGAKKWIGLVIILLFAAGLVAAGLARAHRAQLYPTTDDAYLAGDIVPVAPRIPGTLVRLPVEENQQVRKGRVVAELDPRDMEAAVAKAEAAVGVARSALATDRARIERARAGLAAAESNLDLKKLDFQRFSTLAERDSIPTRRRDQARTALAVARARVKAAAKELEAARAALEVGRRRLTAARKQLDEARLKRSYCTITAPASGTVSKKTAQVGQVVAPGQPLFAIVPLVPRHLWVEANFKETQLARIRPGQPAEIRVDALPGRVYRGRVESLSAGTGAAFSLLPPENATGNWVKIVQRLPVRIALDPRSNRDGALRLGLSAVVTVDTTGGGESSGTGPSGS